MSQNENKNKNIIPISNARQLGFSEERLARISPFFQNYINNKKLAGCATLIARRGEVAHASYHGSMTLDSAQPISPDTIFRIYSMSKPITSVALMMLFEKGLFRLDNPIHKFLPEFSNMKVWDGGNNIKPKTKPAQQPITIQHLLSHTSGLTYDFMHAHPVDRLYRHKKICSFEHSVALSLEQHIKNAAEMPLLFEPGSQWNYSISTDVCGRLVEVLSGMTLDQYFQKYIFTPLQMNDTSFFIPEEKHHRLPATYNKNPATGELNLIDPQGARSPFAKPATFLSGGGGLCSTIGDYLRFAQMTLNGGELDGVRLLSPSTLSLMTDNHLPNRATLDQIATSNFSENSLEGTGFGLGFSVITDRAAAKMPISVGSYSWGGAASTYFWCDPKEELIGIFMTQFMPSDYYPARAQLQQLTYAALV